MATLLARQGRHRQLYRDNRRLVSGCIPYRVIKGCEGHIIKHRFEVLMISSPNRTDLVFPKGGWENDETVHEAASREAFEEAGVRGILNEIELGVWEFRSKSRQAKSSSLEGGCRGYMFALEVTEELETWPEQENHDRKWLSINDAFDLCRYDWMREALTEFLKLMEEDDRQQPNMNNVMVLDSSVKPKMNNQTVLDLSVKPMMNNQTVMDLSVKPKMNNQSIMDLSVKPKMKNKKILDFSTAITPVPDCQVVKSTATNCSVNSKTIVVFQLACHEASLNASLVTSSLGRFQ